MKEAEFPGRRGRTVAAFTAVASAVCAVLALTLGQDANYDQQNYHLYIPYALLNDRILYDIFPAFQGPTFHNPIPYLPFYWLAWNAPPMLIGALLGALHGLTYAPLYLLARTVPPSPLRRSGPVAMVLAALGLTGAIAIAETGTTFIDDLMSALSLSGLAVAAVAMPILARAPAMRAITWAAVAGFPVGLAAGFKLTMAVYGVAFVLAALVVPRRWPERMALAVAVGVGIGIGMLVAGGPWFAIMWAKTGNPIFPYLNQVFQSPLGMAESYRDDSGTPDSLWIALLFPFLVMTGQVIATGVPFFDLRVPTLYTLAIIALVLLTIVRRRHLPLNPSARFALLFAAIAYVLWLVLFSIWRYLLPIEMLAPVLITALVGVIVPAAGRRRAAVLASAALLGLIALTTRPADWGHVPWDRELYGVRVPPIPHPDQALVLMAGTAPTAFTIPFFPARIPFIRLEGFSAGMWDTRGGLARIGEERVRAHQNDIYVLYGFDQEDSAQTVAGHFSLVFDRGACQTVESRLQPVDAPEGPFLLCLLRRAEGAP